MAITGRFQADFDDFFAACEQAQVKLNGIEGEAKQVARGLDQMVASFSGRQVVNEAALMIGAVEGIGGVSKLTDSELQRLTTTVEAAIDKMRLMGTEVPKSFQDVATSAQRLRSSFADMDAQYGRVDAAQARTVTSLSNLDKGLSTVDKTLALLGVNIGPHLQAIRELGAVSGTTATALGTLGTAGALVGTAVAAWSFGRMVAEFFDLDQAIADSTAALLGWGDVAAEEAAAGADAMARASAAVGRDVTTMTEAMAINNAEALKLAGAHKEAATEMSAAWKAARAEYEAWDKDVAAITERLLGNDAVEKANRYRAALSDITAQGLVPMRSQMQEVVTALEAAIKAMQETGRTGELMYRNLVAEHDKYLAKLQLLPNDLLKSGRVDTGVAGVPMVGGNQGVSDSVREQEQIEWLDKMEQGYKELDDAVQKYHDSQTGATSDGVKGFDALTDSVNRTSAALQLAMAMTQGQWLSGKPAGLSVTDYLNTPGPALQGLKGGGSTFGPQVVVHAQGAYFNTPESMQRLGEQVGSAVLARVR